MRRSLCTLVLICTVVIMAVGQEKSAQTANPAVSSNVQQILDARFREYSEALTKRDVAALDKIWAEGYTFTNGQDQFLTKKDRMENLKSGATQFESISRDGEEIRVFGDAAVMTGRVVLKARYSGKESSGPYRYINVWAKIQGHWQLVANQITPVAR
jgi:ketosteroid isomerase-like protein